MKTKKIFASFLLAFFLLSVFAFSLTLQAANYGDYQKIFKKKNPCFMFIDFVNSEQKQVKNYKYNYYDYIVIGLINLPISFIAFWVGIRFFAGKREHQKTRRIKRYIWFLFASNLFWFLTVFVFTFLWGAVDYLVLRIQPNLFDFMVDVFIFTLFFFSIIIYLWLLSRTFELEFSDACKTAILVHLIYAITSAAILTVTPYDTKIGTSLRKNMGYKLLLRGYVIDTFNISENKPIINYLRLRSYVL